MVHILIEKGYEGNNRAVKILDGVLSAARKRHEDIITYEAAADIPMDAEVAIVLSQSLSFTVGAVEALAERGIHPLVFGFEQLDTAAKYSSVSPDYTKSAYKLTRYLLGGEGGVCAVLGYNGDSLPDRLKYIGIKRAASEAGATLKVYKNRGNLSECLAGFAAEAEGITHLITCNGNIAVALYVRYRELLDTRPLGSCSAMKICEFFDIPCPMCRINYLTAGTELARLYFFLKKEGGRTPCNMTMELDSDLPDTPAPQKKRQRGEEVDFWADESLRVMESLDRMLMECDGTDLEILRGITAQKTYEWLAEELFLSVNTVKYRIKKMLESANLGSRKELCRVLSEYKILCRED